MDGDVLKDVCAGSIKFNSNLSLERGLSNDSSASRAMHNRRRSAQTQRHIL